MYVQLVGFAGVNLGGGEVFPCLLMSLPLLEIPQMRLKHLVSAPPLLPIMLASSILFPSHPFNEFYA